MLNIVIVDDEYIVLKGLEAVIKNQQEFPCTVYSSTDSSEVLEKASSWRPDVLIADINMPETDGLALITAIKEDYPGCVFFIISGYETLEYLKSAIALHVKDYLPKPVDKIRLLQQLKQLEAEKTSRNSITLQMLYHLLFTTDQYQTSLPKASELMQLFPNTHMAVCAMYIAPDELEKIKSAISPYFEVIYHFTKKNQTVFILNYSEALSLKNLYDIWKLICRCPVGIVQLSKNDFISIKSHAEYFLLYQNAIRKLLSVYMSINYVPLTIPMAESSPVYAVIQQTLSISDYLHTFSANISDMHIRPAILSDILLVHMTVTGRKLTEKDILSKVAMLDSPLETEGSLYEEFMISWIRSLLTSFWHYNANTPRQQLPDSINKACNYISKNYCYDISLENVAEYVGLHPSYFSTLFKKEMNASFLQYLHQYRIKKACSLMINHPHMSIDEIAIAAGYSSSTYFYRVFKNQMGMSPKQWLQTDSHNDLHS